jgi:hypothetical protein
MGVIIANQASVLYSSIAILLINVFIYCILLFMIEFDPGNCGNCQMVEFCTTTVAYLEASMQDVVVDAMSSGLDEFAEQLYSQFDGPLEIPEDAEATLTTADGFAAEIRKRLGAKVQQGETDIKGLKVRSELLVSGCQGPLKMRAKKNGRTITATVCTSSSLADGDTTEPTMINRSWK